MPFVLRSHRRPVGIEHDELEQIDHGDFTDFSPIADELSGFDGRITEDARATRIRYPERVVRFCALFVIVGGLFGLTACSGDGEETMGTGAGGAAGQGGQGGQAIVLACPPGERESDDGSCQPAGVPEGGCAEGFAWEDGGCVAILPDGPCPSGMMAVPGETACREVAPCGSGTWGDVAIGADTQHVDASYAGGASDGGPSAPWTTIQEGVDAAADGAVVAVAAGTYPGILITKPITVWGRCPSLVEVQGDPALGFSIVVAATDGPAVVRGIGVTGSDSIVGATDVADASFEQLWIHDTDMVAFSASEQIGPVTATLRDSLLERNGYNGVGLVGGDTTIERTVIRDTAVVAGLGRGVDIKPGAETMGSVVIRASVITRSEEAFLTVLDGSSATVEGSALIDTLPPAGNELGVGIIAQGDLLTLQPSELVIEGSVMDGAHTAGILVSGSNASITTTTVRNTQPQLSDMGLGRGIGVQPLPQEASAFPVFDLSSSLIADNREIGLALIVADATITSTIVRDTRPASSGAQGIGIAAQDDPTLFPGMPAVVTADGVVVERNHAAGVLVAGSRITLRQSRVTDTAPQPFDDSFGDGLAVLSSFGADGSLARSSATLEACHVGDSTRAGIASFAGDVALGTTTMSCNPIHLNGEMVNEHDFLFDDLGGVVCGCEDDPESTTQDTCKVLSEGLEPPAAPLQ